MVRNVILWPNFNRYPPQKIIVELNFDDYGIAILNKGCDYNISSKEINFSLNLQKSSSSFNITNDYISE